MADTTITDIGDRLHAINASIGMVNGLTVHRERYWPGNFDTYRLPLLVPQVGPEQRQRTATDDIEETQTWYIFAFIDYVLEGTPPGDRLQKTVEAMIQAMKDLYDPRPRLQNNDNGLAFCDRAMLRGHGGIENLSESIPVLIRFQFEIAMEHIEEPL